MVSSNTKNGNKTEGTPIGAPGSQEGQGTNSSLLTPPSTSLPKGGGAIRGMGEKFAANPVTGTGSMSVPIAVSPGRGGFGPQLSLSYDSGAGNGPFGLGWNLSLPAITRKTDKGLPRYNDAEESDVFILSGAEDLVPVLNQNGQPPAPEIRNGFQIKRYRPRIEGLFARIERWTNITSGEIHWRSITKDNLTTLHGRDNYSRIFDPAELDQEHPTDLEKAHPKRIFSWLISESYDDKGNAILYEYKPEDSARVTLTQANETNRTPETRSANRYLKRIKYCNQTPRAANEDLTQREDWLMEVVFDYADHNPAFPTPNDDKTKNASGALLYSWTVSDDPFSTYRSGFEVRTYRLCQRVLMFHHFPNNSNPQEGYAGLVRSTDFTYTKNHIASFISKVTQSGYSVNGNTYLKRSLPPVEIHLQQSRNSEQSRRTGCRKFGEFADRIGWISLSMGRPRRRRVSGILTEQADAWFYKRNRSPLTMRRRPSKRMAKPKSGSSPMPALRRSKPSLYNLPSKASPGGGMQFLDLAGDGRPDLVQFDGVTPGFFEHTEPNVWETHRPFKSLPNLNWRDPNLKFIDLTGDGHADILISEDEVFTWYLSLAEDGFGPSERVRNPFDEEKGPALVFADGTQSIYLADFSGDGLTDLARIRNGEVCYWPNLGYGRFGAKVTMDNAPWFDRPDQFDQRRIRLADIDGSGGTDIIYLHDDGVRLHFNQSGNRLSEAKTLGIFPHTDNLSSVTVADLLGNGTACLVWSSPLPGEARRQMRYVDLMGGQKPHLMISSKNNLGAETKVQYAPSTKFYLEDKYAGKPWITRLPFPVHVVERVTFTDKWRKTKFSSTYSYHHGYFDGVEREFRGFGRVEQTDIESYDKFQQGNANSPYITADKTLYQPPVKTVTWFHTGAFFDRERILNQFQDEYFSKRLETLLPAQPNVKVFRENVLPEPDVHDQDLSAEEWREALRACKGMTLRQEVYELDVDELHEHGKHKPVRLFSTAYHNCHIRRLQPKGKNKHAVFLVTESEAITYHYELDLRPATPKPDPRIAHTFNLNIDKYGNILQSVAVVYPRFEDYTDSSLPTGAVPLINKVQNESHIAYTETRYTGDVNELDTYRLRVPCEVMTYELTGVRPQDEGDKRTNDPIDDLYFTLDELRAFRLSKRYQTSGKQVQPLEYHELPDGENPEMRLVEHARTLFFKTDLTGFEPLGTFNHLGLPYENYKLALTEALLSAVFGNKLTREVRRILETENRSGYLTGGDLTHRFPGEELSGQYWIRSGVAGFNADADAHFYLPENYTDPFGNITSLDYDPRDLYIKSSRDALLNRTEVTQFDFRVLAPREMVDINGNHSEAAFDILGQVIAVAAKGKFVSNRWEGDDLSGFDLALCNPPTTQIQTFCTDTTFNEPRARGWLNRATTRFVYHFGEARDAAGNVTAWASRPAGACGIQREIHASQTGGSASPLQVALECSDGSGNVLMKKVQAEPETKNGPLRWIVNGLTVLNNKGKPVKQYEPAFSNRFGCELPAANGVTPVMYYDAAGRLSRTELPDGSFSHVEFSPWHVTSYDQNDTAYDPAGSNHSDWYSRRTDSNHPKFNDYNSTENRRSADLVKPHSNTPAVTFLDSLGREVISVAHNRVEDPAGPLEFNGKHYHDEKYVTFTKLDAEGKPLWIRDSRRNLVSAVHHANQTDARLLSPISKTSRPFPRAASRVTTSPAICCFSTAWMRATAGC
ncbi:MAG: hypothetical protein IPG76_00380 [Acidobacteria bacterium]|nr:hypothetical protein [Acidobacteriota bacterium]